MATIVIHGANCWANTFPTIKRISTSGCNASFTSGSRSVLAPSSMVLNGLSTFWTFSMDMANSTAALISMVMGSTEGMPAAPIAMPTSVPAISFSTDSLA